MLRLIHAAYDTAWREMPVLADAQRRHPDIAFVFLNQQEDAAAIARYLACSSMAKVSSSCATLAN